MVFIDPSPHQPVVLVPDIHQNLDFLESAVALAEREQAALCFLGDFVDAADSRWASPSALQAVAARIAELSLSRASGCVVLIGNHDHDALRVARFREKLVRDNDTKGLADLDSALPLAPHYHTLLTLWPAPLLATWGIAAFIHDTVLTHAGVARRLWPWSAAPDPAGQARAFVAETDRVWQDWIRNDIEHPLFAAGPGRGGVDSPVGGPLWLDWDTEFVDDLPFPQAVGHTRAKTVRRKDRSWCLDAAQTHVGLLDPDFGLREIKLF